LLDEVGSLAALQASHESEIKQLKAQLDSERGNASTINLKLLGNLITYIDVFLHCIVLISCSSLSNTISSLLLSIEERQLKESSQRELQALKIEKEKVSLFGSYHLTCLDS